MRTFCKRRKLRSSLQSDANQKKIDEVALQSEQISDEESFLKCYPMIRMNIVCECQLNTLWTVIDPRSLISSWIEIS